MRKREPSPDASHGYLPSENGCATYLSVGSNQCLLSAEGVEQVSGRIDRENDPPVGPTIGP